MSRRRSFSITMESPKDIDPSVTTKPQPVMTLRIEDAFETLGGFSRFQLLATLCIILPEIPAAMIAVAPVFVGGSGRVQFVCQGQDQGTDPSSSRIFLATDPALCASNCTSRYPLGSSPYQTIVEEWNLICDSAWLNDFFTSVQMAGMMFGSLVASFLADKIGRKKCFYCMCVMMGVCGLGLALAPDPWTFGLARFLAGTAVGGFYSVYSIYLIEFLTPSWRTVSGCVTLWSLGVMILPLLAYIIPPWRTLTLTLALPSLLSLISWPFLPESPRWFFCKKRTKEAAEALESIAKINSKPPLTRSTIDILQDSILREESGDTDLGLNKEAKKGHSRSPEFLQLLVNPVIRTPLLLFSFGCFSCAVVYYGSSFNVKNVSGDPYWNVFFMGLVDLPAFPSGAIFNNWLGRKRTFTTCLTIGGGFLLALVILIEIYGLDEYPNLVMVLSFLGRFGVAAAWGVVQCFACESFPTVVRSSCLGICVLAGSVGGVISPQLALLGTMSPALPYFILCGLTVAAAASSCLLVETRGQPLHNLIHQ